MLSLYFQIADNKKLYYYITLKNPAQLYPEDAHNALLSTTSKFKLPPPNSWWAYPGTQTTKAQHFQQLTNHLVKPLIIYSKTIPS